VVLAGLQVPPPVFFCTIEVDNLAEQVRFTAALLLLYCYLHYVRFKSITSPNRHTAALLLLYCCVTAALRSVLLKSIISPKWCALLVT
jgi:hypothetical protein